MGYTTKFKGSFKLNRKLDEKTSLFLDRLSCTRRMERNVELLPKTGFEKYGLTTWGIDGEFYVDSLINFGQEETEDVVNPNRPPHTQPGLWCQWAPNHDSTEIEWNGGEKFYYYEEWLKYIIEIILRPRGYVLNGVVEFQGEDIEDHGYLVAKENEISIRTSVPVREKKPFRYPDRIAADRALAIRELVEGNDNAKAWSVIAGWIKEDGIVKVLQDTSTILEFNGLDTKAEATFLNQISIRTQGDT